MTNRTPNQYLTKEWGRQKKKFKEPHRINQYSFSMKKWEIFVKSLNPQKPGSMINNCHPTKKYEKLKCDDKLSKIVIVEHKAIIVLGPINHA